MTIRLHHFQILRPHTTVGWAWSMLLLSAVMWTGCGNPSQTGPGGSQSASRDTTITDALGREVTLRVPVSGLAPLAPSVTEMIALVAGTGSLVGVTDADTWPPEVENLPTYQVLPVDFERLAMLGPDLVLASSQVNAPRDARALEALGIPVVYLAGSNLEDVLNGLSLIGELTGRTERAYAVIDSLQNRLHALMERTSRLETRPDAVFLISTGTPWSFGPESYMHDVMLWAGLESVTRTFPNEAPVLTDEFMMERAPEIIVGPFGTAPDARRELLVAHPLWRTVPAVRDGRIVSVPADLVLRPGPRMIEGAWIMARGAHPQLFRERP